MANVSNCPCYNQYPNNQLKVCMPCQEALKNHKFVARWLRRQEPLIPTRSRMTSLRNPGLSPESARQRLYDNLQQGGTLVWYDDAADSATILAYVLRIMGLTRSDLLVSDFGYGIAPDESVAVIRLRGAAGGHLCQTYDR